MSKEVLSSLKTAVKGTALLVASSGISLVLWFFVKLLIIRKITQAEFGIYSLALTVLSIAVILSSLGFYEGTARNISVSRGEGDTGQVKGIIKSAVEVVFLSGIIASAVLYALSGTLSEKVFKMPELSTPLKIVAFGVLISVMLNLITAIFRGQGTMGVKAAVDVAQPLVYIALLAGVFLFEPSFVGVMIAYIAAIAFLLIGLSIYSSSRLNLGEVLFRKIATCRRNLVIFSLPLLGVALTGLVLNWTDTLMLGYFMQPEDVGVYNAGVSLSRLLLYPVAIMNFVLMPIAGELYARGRVDDLKRTYQVLTKWIFTAAVPVFLVLFFFPEMTLTFLFGKQYETAHVVLMLLSVRYMAALFVGSSGLLLTVLGRPRLLMAITIGGSSLNIVLNYVMIPVYGPMGAAIATLLSAFAMMGTSAAVLYRLSGIHPFTAKYLKPVAASAVIALAIYAIAKSIPLYFWMLPVYFLLFIGGYILSILFTRSIENEDIEMFEAVTQKLGFELSALKRLFGRFAHK